ncbi:indoleacetamide hydrolase [Aquincola sp. J276]|uniref:indoleacetamide hydrolase n=1 Tax=Aquincola sp. J276 TaxID=2898432 RepID=UPI00215083D5|nr:indoleacetamide hydrolase [Aquincola sp. J276]MCR5867294.1 indoleacetamide hydrolase [Aquincola sp. J276]
MNTPHSTATALLHPYLHHTAYGAVRAMQAGALSCSAYAHALVQRAEAVRNLNGLIHHDPALLLQRATALDAAHSSGHAARLPLYGLPLAFKDNIDVAGLPTTAGTPWLAGHVPQRHAGVVQRLLAAGALVFGKSNLHEWSQGVTGHNHHFGPARNPHAPDHVAGGSSGGNAVLLAAHAVPVAIGTDTGGSVRVPAALCGLVGFRPTVGRWPDDGLVPISPTFDTAGVMARCVADCMLVDAVASGRSGAAPPALPSPAVLRLGVPQAWFWRPLDDDTAACCQAGLQRLQAAGVQLVPVELGEAGALFNGGAMSISLFEILPALQHYFRSHGRGFDVQALFDGIASPDVRPLFARPMGPERITPQAYRHAMQVLRPRLQSLYRQTFAQHRLDAVLYPTTPLPAVPIGQDVTVVLDGQPVPAFSAYIRNTGPAGMAGLPSISLPAGCTPGGLPVGLCLDGAAGQDARLLAVAQALETVMGG